MGDLEFGQGFEEFDPQTLVREIELPVKYTFDAFRWKIARAVGTARTKRDRAAGVKDRSVDTSRDLLERDIESFAAEWAVAEICNIAPDFTTEPRKGGIDLTWHDGRTIDVKCTPHRNGKLIMPVHKVERLEVHADIAFLVCTTDSPTFELVGWLPMEELVDRDRLGKLPGRDEPTYIVERWRLNQRVKVLGNPPLEPKKTKDKLFDGGVEALFGKS